MDIFKDIIPSLVTSKKYCLEDEKEYIPLIVNKSISYLDDGLFYATEMNNYPDLPNRAQYNYYFHTIKGKRRPFTPWIKTIKNDDVLLLQKYFGYNDKKAKEVLNIITKQQLKMIQDAYNDRDECL